MSVCFKAGEQGGGMFVLKQGRWSVCFKAGEQGRRSVCFKAG